MLEYTVIKQSSKALQPNLPYYVVYFLVFHLTNVSYDITVHVHKNSFYLCVGGNYFELESNIHVSHLNMKHKFINSKSCRNQKSCNNM